MTRSTPPADTTAKVAARTVSRLEEETLVADDRALITPSQFVEQRLMGMLKSSPVMMSQVQRRLKPGPR